MAISSLSLSDRTRARTGLISGAGGAGGGKGGGGAGGSVEAKDTLFSVSNARILVALGEGPLEGPDTADFAQSLILNDTPLVSPSGNRNYEGFSIEWRNGSDDQSYIPGFADRERERGIGLRIFQQNPVIHTVLDPDTDAVRVRVRIPALREVKEDGSGSVGSEVRYEIDVASRGTGFVNRFSDGLSGKTTSPYERQHTIKLTGQAPWSIRVVRITADSTSERIANEIFLQAVTEVQFKRRRYPDTALIAILIDARQFNSIPTVFLDTKGLRVLVPNNYDADNGTYSGFFDGTLRESWTNNPVWVLLDLLTDTRYGAGLKFSRIDLASFYAAAVYCDERISNGEGGTERRWVFNGSIETREEAFKICEAVASTFNGLLYWSGSQIRLSVDRLQRPFRTYSRSNVISARDGNGRLTTPPFQYSEVSSTSFHTVANISYRDPTNGYKLKTIQYRNEEGIKRFGYRPIDITAFGCTSRTQAYRYGKWRILTELTQKTTVSFQVGREGLLNGLGDVIYVYDTALMGSVLSGRVVGSTANSVTFDSAITLESDGSAYELLTTDRLGRSQHNAINLANSTAESGTSYRTVSIVGSFGANAPADETLWGIVGGAVKPQQFQIINIAENDAEGSYRIDAVQYEPGKFAAIEDDVPLIIQEIFSAENPYASPDAVTNLVVNEYLFSNTGSSGVRVGCDISWSHSDSRNNRAARFRVEMKSASDPEWQIKGESATRTFTINDVLPGSYEFRITSISSYGVAGRSSTTSAVLYGLTEPPATITGFSSQYFNGSLKLIWNKSPDLDVRIGGDILLYHTPIIGATDDGKSARLIATLPGDQTQHLMIPTSGTYYVQSRDSSGNLSSRTTSLAFDGASVIARNVVVEAMESPNFNGLKQNAVIDPTLNALAIGNKALGQAIYEFEEVIDLGGVIPVRVIAELVALSVNESEKFDDAVGLFDSRAGLFDAAESSNSSAILQYRSSDNGVTYTEWRPLANGDYSFRFCQLRLMMNTKSVDYNVYVSLLRVLFDVDDLIQEGSGATSTSSETFFSFRNSFFQPPLVVGNIQNPVSGDYLSITGQTKNGFFASVFNAAGERISKNIVYIAKGF